MGDRSECSVEFTEEENDTGRMQDAVYVTCNSSDTRVGPIWGHGPRSVRRGLAMLRDECPDGCYHVPEDPEDAEGD